MEGRTLAFATRALGHFVATSPHIRGAVAHRPSLFDSLISALGGNSSSGGGVGARGGKGRGGAGGVGREHR